MAKIAVAVEQALAQRERDGTPGCAAARPLARGEGWTVEDVICTSGPRDRPFEEQHSMFSIAVVAAGSFQYRSTAGGELMTPGSLLLGNPGQCFECGHEHGSGDRCISFRYSPEYFERIASGAGGRQPRLPALRLPAMRSLSPVVTRACYGLAGAAPVSWEELSVQLAGITVQMAGDVRTRRSGQAAAIRSVTHIVRQIEQNPAEELSLATLAEEAGLSPFHFLRTFEDVAGTTPHQYILRMRLREAAIRLATSPDKVLDIALDCGFGDVSNFNRAFRAEFGVSPRAYRRGDGWLC